MKNEIHLMKGSPAGNCFLFLPKLLRLFYTSEENSYRFYIRPRLRMKLKIDGTRRAEPMAELWLAGAIAVVLGVYLVYALIKPEKF